MRAREPRQADRSRDEAAIATLVKRRTRAGESKDAAASIALLTADATGLELGAQLLHDTDAMEKWFASWDGPLAV